MRQGSYVLCVVLVTGGRAVGGHHQARWQCGRQAAVQSVLSIMNTVQLAAGVWLTLRSAPRVQGEA